jgi:hypothetical protein
MRLRIGEAASLICNINIKVGARRFNNNYRHAIQLAVPSYGIILRKGIKPTITPVKITFRC